MAHAPMILKQRCGCSPFCRSSSSNVAAPPPAAVPNYWEDLRGTRATPMVIEAADGKGTVAMENMNLKDVR